MQPGRDLPRRLDAGGLAPPAMHEIRPATIWSAVLACALVTSFVVAILPLVPTLIAAGACVAWLALATRRGAAQDAVAPGSPTARDRMAR